MRAKGYMSYDSEIAIVRLYTKVYSQYRIYLHFDEYADEVYGMLLTFRTRIVFAFFQHSASDVRYKL